MKKTFLFLIVIICLGSCNRKEKYEGKWVSDISKSENDGSETPMFFHIENDSIKFSYWSFNYSHKYALKIEKNKFLFNNWSIKADMIEDTILLQNSFYIKDNNDSIISWLWDKPITKIELPKTNSEYFNSESINYDAYKYYMLFGKRLDNNKFSLQLNDKHAKIEDLPAFICIERASERHELIPFYSTYLLAEKTTPMKYLEDIFFEHKKVNQLKICFINDIQLKYSDSLGLYYKYEKLTKKLPPFREHDDYHINTLENRYQSPPPPPLYYSESDDKKPNTKLILLKNNRIYYKDSIIETNHLKNLIKPWIEKNNTILNLYDLESNYHNFLEMNAIINSVYQNVRQEKSKIKFNKTLNELNREELTEIKIETPMRHIWDYSIQHFNRIVKKENSFYGLAVTPIE